MINFNGMENRKLAMINAVLETKMKGKELVIAVITKPSDWIVNWAWFAKKLNVGIGSIYTWINKASELGIWKIDKDLNIEFLPTFFEKFSNFEKISKTENENTISNFEKKFSKTEKISKTENNKQEFGKNLKFTEKQQEKQESACVREIDNVECETSQNLDKAHEIGQISENADLSAQISADFAEFETSQTQENENRADFLCAGGENLTQINNRGEGVARTAQHGETSGTASGQGSGAVALGLQKIAFSSSEKPAKMSIGEAYANWQRQIRAAAEFSVRGGENLTQINKPHSVARTAQRGETSEANEPRELQTHSVANGANFARLDEQPQTHSTAQTSPALKTPKKQPKTAQTPEQTAEAMLEKHSEIAKGANFSESEREAVLDYFAYKAEHKKYPLTERNSKAILRQCVKIKGENKDLPEIIERTIANGWADLRWVADKPAPSNNAWQKPQQNDWRATLARVRQRQAAEAARSV